MSHSGEIKQSDARRATPVLAFFGGSGSIGIFAAARGNGGSDTRRRRTGGDPAPPAAPAAVLRPGGARSKGLSRPAQADHAELAALETAARQAAHERRRHAGRLVDGVEILRDGTELHLASSRLADAKLRLEGADRRPRLRGAQIRVRSAARRQGCRRAAAWVSPSRRATRRRRGRAR